MTLAWILFAIYLGGTAWLGWLGFKKTRDFGSFAIGSGDMSPLVVGITLAASTASASTFIINPGFVYVDGWAAWMHLAGSVYLGFVGMLILLSFRFRRIGAASQALTIPDWIGKRYSSKNFALYFSIVNLFSFAFIVLLVGGISIVMQKLLQVNNETALMITLVFVTAYVFLGGTYAHVYTNVFQGSLMILVTLMVVYSGLVIMLKSDPPFWQQVAAIDPNLVKLVNPESKLYNDFFSIYVSGFLIGAALVCQPHILTKALYVKSDQAVKRYIGVFGIGFFLFLLLLLVGFWARVAVPAEALMDPTTGAFRQDLVMTVYLQQVFPDWVFTLISIVLLAAAMSTLDGLLVGISTITANDFVLNLMNRFGAGKRSPEAQMRIAYRASHLVLILLAVSVYFVNLHPPKLLGIFGQTGVYGLVLATVPPLLMGVLFEKVSMALVWIASLVAIGIHFGLFFYGTTLFPESGLAFGNPGLTGAIALLLSNTPVVLATWWTNKRRPTV